MNLGFAIVISGSERATLAVAHARRFRAEQLLAGSIELHGTVSGPPHLPPAKRAR